MLVTAGAAAMGLVLGWWCAPLAGAPLARRNAGGVAGALAAMALETLLLGGAAGAIVALLGGSGVGFAAHAAWRQWLADYAGHNRG